MRPDDQKNEFVVWIVFFFTVVYSMLGHLLIYFFEDKMRVLPSLGSKNNAILTNSEIAQHSLMIRGINKHLSP